MFVPAIFGVFEAKICHIYQFGMEATDLFDSGRSFLEASLTDVQVAYDSWELTYIKLIKTYKALSWKSPQAKRNAKAFNLICTDLLFSSLRYSTKLPWSLLNPQSQNSLALLRTGQAKWQLCVVCCRENVCPGLIFVQDNRWSRWIIKW